MGTPVLEGFRQAAPVAEKAGYYSMVLAGTIPFRVVYSQVTQYFTAQKIMDPIFPTAVLGTVFNLVVGLQFVLGFPFSSLSFGFAACPIVTVCAEALQVLFLLVFYCGVRKLHAPAWPGWAREHITRARIWEYSKMYIPAAVTIGSDFWRMSAVGAVAAAISPADLAVFTTSYRFLWMGLILISSTGRAVGIQVSIALGSGDVQQCKERIRVGFLVILAELVLLAAVVLVFARSLGVIFTTDPEVLALFEESRGASR